MEANIQRYSFTRIIKVLIPDGIFAVIGGSGYSKSQSLFLYRKLTFSLIHCFDEFCKKKQKQTQNFYFTCNKISHFLKNTSVFHIVLLYMNFTEI